MKSMTGINLGNKNIFNYNRENERIHIDVYNVHNVWKYIENLRKKKS